MSPAGKSPRLGNDRGWEMTAAGKCPRLGNDRGWEMSAVGKCLVGEYPGWEMTKSGNDRREISGRDIAGWEMVLHHLGDARGGCLTESVE